MGLNKKIHPSYGKVSISRFNSNRAEFFNSDLYHSGGITLEISNASVERRHGSECVYSEEQLIQVRMSNSQFIDAITSGMNTDGVPCTIERVAGERVAPDTFVQPHQDKFRSDMRGVYADLEQRIEELEELLTLGDWYWNGQGFDPTYEDFISKVFKPAGVSFKKFMAYWNLYAIEQAELCPVSEEGDSFDTDGFVEEAVEWLEELAGRGNEAAVHIKSLVGILDKYIPVRNYTDQEGKILAAALQYTETLKLK